MTTLFINIKYLIGVLDASVLRKEGAEMNELVVLHNAFLYIENDKILSYGCMWEPMPSADTTIDVKHKSIMPTWCDSHTHIVFAEPRAAEFEMKIQGKTYEEIAAAGGGILNSAMKLQAIDPEKLFEVSATRLEQVMAMGTGAIEIKSGYGLTLEAEMKMLKTIRRLKENYPIPIKSTFLGAHAFPKEYKDNQEGYISLLINEMIPSIVGEGLADYIDVFCENGFFSVDQTNRILEAGAKYGLKPKIHANQLHISGGVQVGVKNKAISVDHLENIDEEVIDQLKHQNTIATLLPSCSFFIKIPYAPARKLIDAGLGVALASDFNPGSTPSGNMNLVVSLACIQMRMTPAEAINAATINGAYAMELSETTGSISKHKMANFIITETIPNIAFIPYNFGRPAISEVWIKGKRI
jgi:imidazolonepropionase